MLQAVLFVVMLTAAPAHKMSPAVWSTRQAHPDAALVVALAVKQSNIDVLEEHFWAVSDPASPRRGQYLSFQEVGDLVHNPVANQAAKEWAASEGFPVVKETAFGEYVLIQGSVQRFGEVFSTTFEHYQSRSGAQHLACSELTVPAKLKEHVHGILGAIHTPVTNFNVAPGHVAPDLPVPIGFYPLPFKFNGTMTPQKIKAFYNVDNDHGSPMQIQDIFSDGQTYTLKDLDAFRSHFGLDRSTLPQNVPANFTGGPCTCSNASWLQCITKAGNCMEASLDVQYLAGVSQLTKTRVHDLNNGDLNQALHGWILDAATRTDQDLALVHSISYGIAERNLRDFGLVTSFNIEAMKLGTRGVSIFVASGDGGVCDGHGSLECGYIPVFPASSPFVTAVGGTMGPETGLPERVCNIADGGSYTAGGGFSSLFPTPTYQQKAVSGYLQGPTGKTVLSGFNASNRAYPDVTFASNNFEVVVGGSLLPMASGTSAAAPSLAGLFSLVNARRMENKMPSVGFVNPTLYATGTEGCCNDIVNGANMCTQWLPYSKANTCYTECINKHPHGLSGLSYAAFSECTNECLDSSCMAGFPAAAGWDPASGLGSPDFQKLLQLFGVKGASVMV